MADIDTSKSGAHSEGAVLRYPNDKSPEYEARLKGVRMFVWSYSLVMLALLTIAILVSLGPGPAKPF